jgi:hypothetical protein
MEKWDETYQTCFYFTAATIEKLYDVDLEDFGKCAAIAAKITDKAMAKYNYQDENGDYPNYWDCIHDAIDEELPRYFKRRAA